MLRIPVQFRHDRKRCLQLMRTGLAFVGVTAFLIFIHVRLHEYAFDDAYIHFRIADHLANGGSPYFNSSEAINASSSPGWTITLALIIWVCKTARIPLDLPLVISIFNAMATVGGAVIYASLLARIANSRRAAIIRSAFFIFYISMILSSSVGLMEIPLALALIGIAFHLLLSNNTKSIIIFAAAPFFRIEFAAVLGLVLLSLLIYKQFSLKRVVLYAAMGMMPFMAYEWYFFNTLIPNTIMAKSVVYEFSYIETLQNLALGFTPNISTPFFHYHFTDHRIASVVIVVLVIMIMGLAIGRVVLPIVVPMMKRSLDPKQSIGTIMALWGIGLFCAYLFRKIFLFPWYVPLYGIPILFSVALMVGTLRPGKLALMVFVFLSPIIVCQVADFTQAAFSSVTTPAYYKDFASGARVRRYIETGRMLYDLYPDATLLSSEIGGLGYGFHGRIIDAVGLASPSALRYHPMAIPEERSNGAIGAIPVGFVEEVNPDIIVTYEVFAESLLRSDAIKRYTRTEYPVFIASDASIALVMEVFSSRHFYVFIRNDLAHKSTD